MKFYAISMQYDKMSVESTESKNEIDKRSYISTVHLNSLSFINVGYYYCVKKSAMTTEFVDKIDNHFPVVSELLDFQ